MASKIRRMISTLVVGVLSATVILGLRHRYKVELINNDDAVVLNAPSFSCASGFYQREFDLEIFSDEGSSIYYTLDGSAPDE